jgi:uncharacterized protein (TIGR03437 family)
VAPGEIDLTLGGAAELTGKHVVLSNPDGAQTEYFAAMPSIPDQTTISEKTQPLLSMQTWTSVEETFTVRGGAVALQNPNPSAVDVILQTQSIFSPLDSQTTVTIPAGALNVYSALFGGRTGLRAFASVPIRVLGMGFSFPLPGSPAYFVAPPSPTLPPVQQLTASPAAVAIQWQAGTAIPGPVNISLSATVNHAAFSFRAMPPAGPFSVTPTQATAPATLTVSVNPAGLSAGTYSGKIVLTPEGPNAVVTSIPLSLTVSGNPLVVVNPQKFTFIGPDDYSQVLNVASNGNPMAFTAAAADGSGPHWLTVSPSGGTTPAQLRVNVDSRNLSEGTYSGQVTIAGPNNSVTVPVDVNVSAANIFSFSPTAVTFSAQTGSSFPLSQTVAVYGPSSGVAFFASTSSGGPWLTAVRTSSGFGAVVTVNPAGLKSGTYAGKVSLTSPVSMLPIAFPVTLALWDKEPLLMVTPPSVTFTTTLPADPSMLGPQLVYVDSGGVPVNFTVRGRPGSFVTPASIPAAGEYVSTLGAYEYDITIIAGSQTVVVPVTKIVTTSALTPPSIGSVVNAASQIAGSVAPGEILTIYGFGAGPSNAAGFTLDASGKLATSLNGAQVLFDGRPAPMIYGSASQAEVMAPYEVADEAITTIALQYGGVTSAGWAIPVTATAPAIFTLAASGLGQAAALNQDNSVNGASSPAARGSVIQIYATGEGQTSPPGVTGSLNGTDPKTPVGEVKVTIGGQDAVVRYAGSAPNSVSGLLQVNVVVPQTVTPGAAVPINLSVGGVPSQSGVSIAVQ